MNGWLSPEGEYIPCESYQHDKTAREHGYSEVKWESMGYAKIFNGGGMVLCERFLTDAQQNWLIDHDMMDE